VSIVPLLSPEEIAVRAGRQAPLLHFPVRAEVFAERSLRLRQRAAAHPMRDYLLLMADLAQAQHETLQSHPPVPLPDAPALREAAAAGEPALPAMHWPRDPAWRLDLQHLVDALRQRVPAGKVADALTALRLADVDLLERQADRLLQQVSFGLDLAFAPFIAAALQVYWTQLVLATQALHGAERLAPFGRIADATLCPCCGSLPVASVVRIDPGAGGLRYLQCALCSSQWHMVRVKCAHCEGSKGVAYQSLEPAAGPAAAARQAAVEAETCDECGSYLKIVRKERDPDVEAVADDLATLTLDLLVAEAGYQRHGSNLLLLFGDAESPPDGGGG
jgi:FdhE protein